MVRWSVCNISLSHSVCELIAAEYFMTRVYWIFMASQSCSPIDLIAVNENGPRLLQVKKNDTRVDLGRSKPARIHRVRTELQKQLNREATELCPPRQGHHLGHRFEQPPLRRRSILPIGICERPVAHTHTVLRITGKAKPRDSISCAFTRSGAARVGTLFCLEHWVIRGKSRGIVLFGKCLTR